VADHVVHLAGDPPSLAGQRGGPGQLLLADVRPGRHRLPLRRHGAVQPLAGQPGEDPDDDRDGDVADLVVDADLRPDERVDLDRGEDREQSEHRVAAAVGVLGDGVRDDQQGGVPRHDRGVAQHRLEGDADGDRAGRGERPDPPEHETAGDQQEGGDLQRQLLDDLAGEHHQFQLRGERQGECQQAVADPQRQAAPPVSDAGHGGERRAAEAVRTSASRPITRMPDGAEVRPPD
jgi:hypothetical protein